MPSLQFNQVLLTALLPVFSTLVAGIARQDRAPAWLNDFISFVTPLGAGVINAAANGVPANGNGLLFLAISTLVANLAHTPFLFNIQQELQSRVLSLGVKPAQLQQFEGFVEHTIEPHMPQMEALLMQLIDEVRGSRVPTSNNTPSLQPPAQAAPAYGTLFPVTNNATAQAPGTVTVAAPASVPQQPFPAQTLHWGDTGVVPAQK